MSATTFLNIQVNFDKLYQFNLLRDNLTWQQLATVIQSSIPEAAAKDSFSLYYTLDDGKSQTLHNQDEFSQLLSVNGDNLLGLRLYGETQDDMKSVYILPRTNDSFKKLSEFVDLHYHELESSFCLSRMVGILATHIVYAPENKEDFVEEFSQLEKLVNCRSTDRGEFRKMMRERKHLWKRHLHREGKMSGRWARHHSYLSEDNKNDNADNDNDNESFELVGSDPTREGNHSRRLGRHGRGHHFRRCGGDDDDDDLALKSDNCTCETDNKEKKAKHQEKKNAEDDSSSSSESKSEDVCRRFGRRGGHGSHGGRGRRHHFDPAEFQEHSGERHHRRHGRHGHGRHGFGGPVFDGERGFGFGGKHHPHHHHSEGPSDTDLESFPYGFGPEDRHHRHGRKQLGGKKYFVFA